MSRFSSQIRLSFIDPEKWHDLFDVRQSAEAVNRPVEDVLKQGDTLPIL
jgi:hypothetical protein